MRGKKREGKKKRFIGNRDGEDLLLFTALFSLSLTSAEIVRLPLLSVMFEISMVKAKFVVLLAMV